MYPTFYTTDFLTETFNLKSNQESIGINRILILSGIVIFPTLLAFIIFHFYLELSQTSLLIAIGSILFILLNIVFYFWNTTNNEGRTLIIGFDEMMIFENGQLISKVPFDELQIKIYKWNEEGENSLPAIYLEADNTPPMTIGVQSLSTSLSITQRLDYTDFLVHSHQEWQRLSQVLHDFTS